MRTRTTLSALLGLALLFAGTACGKKGALLPPLSKTPAAPSEITVTQRGRTVVLTWRNPTTYTDGYDLPGLSAVEVWLVEQDLAAGQPAPKAPTAGDFEDEAKLLVRLKSDQFPGALKEKVEAASPEAGPPAKGAQGRPAKKAKPKEKAGAPETLKYDYTLTAPKPDQIRLFFGLRTFDLRGRASDFSGPTAFTPRVLPSPPTGLAGTVKSDALELTWAAPADNIDGSKPTLVIKGYNVYRSVDGGPAVRIDPEPVAGTSTADKAFEFDRDLAYTVRAATQDKEPFWESGDSEAFKVRPEDIFPPAPPAGLAAVAGPDLVSLSWEPSPDKDLAGYRVWRRVQGTTEFQELTSEPLKATTYQDATAERGVRYEYAVTAEDAKGNRSAFSATAVEGIKEARP